MILTDVHPAVYDDGSGRELSPVRAVLTAGRLRVWQAVGRETRLVVDEPVEPVVLESRHPIIGRPITVTLTASGATVTVTRQRGCGCGSPLKRLRPPVD